MFSRCYPTITDLIFDLTGIYLPLPIFSFGFFVAIAFIVAAYFLSRELKRKERLGWIQPFQKEVVVGAPAQPIELIFNALIGFVLGYKLVYVVLNYQDFVANPQSILASWDGNIWAGIAGAALLAFQKYRQKQKEKLDSPQKEVITVYPHQTVGDLVIVAAISGILGSKIFYIVESAANFKEFLQDPIAMILSFGGLTIYGGLIGGTIAVLWWAKSKGMKPIHIADSAAPTLFIAYAIGRQGCQTAGDGDWGIVNTMDMPSWLRWLPHRWWAFDYPNNVLDTSDPYYNLAESAYRGLPGKFVPGCLESGYSYCHVLHDPVFPTPMYETFMGLLLFGLLWAFRKQITIPGLMFSFYIILNGIERFFIEKIRVNAKLHVFGMQSTQAELVALGFILIGILGVIYFTRKYKRQRPPT